MAKLGSARSDASASEMTSFADAGVVRFRFEHDQARLGIMRGGLVWIEQKSLVSPLHRPRIQVHTLVGPTAGIVRRIDERGARESVGVGWIESHRLLE